MSTLREGYDHGELSQAVLSEIAELETRAAQYGGETFKPWEKEIARQLVEIVATTELPRFNPPGIMSTANETVPQKLAYLQTIEELREYMFPETLRTCTIDKIDVATDPVVNNIHAWGWILNAMNGIGEMQRNGRFDAKAILALAQYLSAHILSPTDVNPLRNPRDLFERGEYLDTTIRKLGVKGVNPQRKILFDK